MRALKIMYQLKIHTCQFATSFRVSTFLYCSSFDITRGPSAYSTFLAQKDGEEKMVGVTFHHPHNHPCSLVTTTPPTTILRQLYHTSFVVDGTGRHGDGTWRLLAVSTLQVNLWLSRREPAAARGRWAACTSGLVGTSASPLLTGRLAGRNNLPTWAQPLPV